MLLINGDEPVICVRYNKLPAPAVLHCLKMRGFIFFIQVVGGLGLALTNKSWAGDSGYG